MSDISERLAEAERLSEAVLATDPDNIAALKVLALTRLNGGDPSGAVNLFERLSALEPENPDHRTGLADAFEAVAREAADNRQRVVALDALEQALEIQPGRPRTRAHLAFMRVGLGDFEEALADAETAISLDPECLEAIDVKGLALRGLDRSDDAIECFERVLEVDPDFAVSHVNLGSALFAAGAPARAMTHLRRAVELDPDNAEARNNLGNALAGQLEFEVAEDHLRKAISLNPSFAEAHFNLSMALLMQEKFTEGWDEYEWRWRCPEFPSTWREFSYPFWKGEPLDGKTLLIWSEQGVGDEIMFANTLPDVAASGAQMVLECNDRFVPVFRRSYPKAIVFPRETPTSREVPAGIDYQISMASLCRYYRRDAGEFPAEPGKYLEADSRLSTACGARYDGMGEGIKIGISWRSGNPVMGAERSASLSQWGGILSQPGCTFISLQYGEVVDDIAAAKENHGVIIHVDDDIDPFASMEDWFAQVAAMDLVISVDNSTVQVSGALGVPTWTLLSLVPEWRWLAAGSHNPWHPRMTVYRQAQVGDWSAPIDAVAEALRAQLALRRAQGEG